MTKLAELREIADGAGQGLGPWRVEKGFIVGTEVAVPHETFVVSRPPAFGDDARHIAAFDPPTARALLDIAEAVKAHASSSLVPHSAEWDDALEDIYAMVEELESR